MPPSSAPIAVRLYSVVPQRILFNGEIPPSPDGHPASTARDNSYPPYRSARGAGEGLAEKREAGYPEYDDPGDADEQEHVVPKPVLGMRDNPGVFVEGGFRCRNSRQDQK